MIACRHEEEGGVEENCSVSGFIYWVKQDKNKTQGRDHREAVDFDGEEENAKFVLGHVKMRLPVGQPNRDARRQLEFQVYCPGGKDLRW